MIIYVIYMYIHNYVYIIYRERQRKTQRSDHAASDIDQKQWHENDDSLENNNNGYLIVMIGNHTSKNFMVGAPMWLS